LDRLTHLIASLEAAKTQLNEHPMYDALVSLTSLRVFMSYHVFAVWDFMNLLTALQTLYTSTRVPWKPPSEPILAYLVNAIKLEEESDCIDGRYISHFQFYQQSMVDLGVDIVPITDFLNTTQHGYEEALSSAPTVVQPFLRHTYSCIQEGPVAIAASFAFGRETVIPEMFSRILSQLPKRGPHARFNAYLDRHIELDGNEHGTLAQELVAKTCGASSDAWQKAAQWAQSSIQARIALYSDILDAM
jgi:hypothetical protein